MSLGHIGMSFKTKCCCMLVISKKRLSKNRLTDLLSNLRWLLTLIDGGNLSNKGQLISKCPFGVFKSIKKPTNFLLEFLP